MARVWKIDEDGSVQILCLKNFNEYLINSKFCEEPGSLIATGGLMKSIFVWDFAQENHPVVAEFNHAPLDENFQGCEIEWQNAKCVAVAGKSKFIYLWSVDSPAKPLVVWEGHEGDVEQIQWDPSKRMLASCSSDNQVCIWQPSKSAPELTLDKLESSVITIKWSHAEGAGPDPLLAAGCKDGQILIWNITAGQLLVKLDA